MSLLVNLVIIIISSIVLIKAVKLFIHSSSRIAHTFHISGYTISFLLIAIATSLPETVVGITSALEQNPILSFGNALGSNIALLTIIVAVPGILNSGIHTHSIFKSKDIYYTALFSLFALALSLDGKLNWIDGTALLIGYAIYIIVVLRRSSPLENLLHTFEHTNVWKQFVFFVFSLGLLLIASEGIVRSAINLSLDLNLKLGFIGLTLTALGTSLPEIAYAIGAVRDRKENEIMGDVIGSIVANSTLVLGVTAIIHPIIMDGTVLGVSTNIFLILALSLFLVFSKTREKIDRNESIVLLIVYAAFVFFEFLAQR